MSKCMGKYSIPFFNPREYCLFVIKTGYYNGPKCVAIYSFYRNKVNILTAMNKCKVHFRLSPKAEPPLLEVEVSHD